MKYFKTICQYGYSLLGEKPSRIDNTVEYIVTGESIYLPHCVIIRRVDGKIFQGEKTWIVPQNSIY